MERTKTDSYAVAAIHKLEKRVNRNDLHLVMARLVRVDHFANDSIAKHVFHADCVLQRRVFSDADHRRKRSRQSRGSDHQPVVDIVVQHVVEVDSLRSSVRNPAFVNVVFEGEVVGRVIDEHHRGEQLQHVRFQFLGVSVH